MSATEELLAGKIRTHRTDNEWTAQAPPLTTFDNDDEDIDEQILRLAAVPEPYGRMAARQTLGVLDEMERDARGRALESKQQEARLSEMAAQLRRVQGESEMYRERERQLMDENSSLKLQVAALERQLRDGYPRQTGRLVEENGLLREKLIKYKRLYEEGVRKELKPDVTDATDGNSSLSEVCTKIEEMFRRSPPSQQGESGGVNANRKTEADFKVLFSNILQQMQAVRSESQQEKSTTTADETLEDIIKRLVRQETSEAKGETAPVTRTVSSSVHTAKSDEDVSSERESSAGNHQLVEAVLKALGENREVNAQVLAHLAKAGNERAELDNTEGTSSEPQCGQCSQVDRRKTRSALATGTVTGEPENTLNLMGEYKWTI